MPSEKFEPTPAEQFADEGLPGLDNFEEERRVIKGGPLKAREGKILPKKMVGSEGSKSGFKYDYVDVENIPTTDSGGKEVGEEHLIDLIAARQEATGRKRRLDSGRAILISKPGDSPERQIGQEKGTRQFNTAGELMEFYEKREKAKEKARQRYDIERQRKQKERKDRKAA